MSLAKHLHITKNMDDIKIDRCVQSSADLNNRRFVQFNVQAFRECLFYLESLIDIENKILDDMSSKSLLDEYITNFGTKRICLHLYNGLKRSFTVYFRDKESEKTKEFYLDLESSLNNIYNKMKRLPLFNL